MKRNFLTLAIAAVLIVIFALLLFTFQVRISEVAVVTTFGKPTHPIKEPGLYFKWPWPVQKVHKFDNRVQTTEDKFTEDFTADNQTLMTMVYAGWRITQPEVFFPNFPGGSLHKAEETLASLLRNEKSAAVGRHNLADFVNANARQLKFDQIEKEILDGVQAKLKSNNYGMEVQFLGIKKLGLPESVTQQVFDRMTAERKKIASQTEEEGNEEASKIRSAANAKASEMLAAAEAQAKRIRSEGEAAAAEALPVFQKNPDLAIFLLGLEALEKSLKERSILILDQRTPPFDLLINGLPANQPAGSTK